MMLRWIDSDGVSNHDVAELSELRKRTDGALFAKCSEVCVVDKHMDSRRTWPSPPYRVNRAEDRAYADALDARQRWSLT